MSFVISKVTVAATVSNGGTLTFAYPLIPIQNNPSYPYPFEAAHLNANPPPAQALEQTSAGDFASSNQHVAYSSGNQAKMIFGKDFSLTFNNAIASGVTFTYNGSSTIPVGSVVSLQLELVGQNDGAPFKNDARIGRGAMAPIVVVRFGTPIAASTTQVLATTAVAAITLQTLATPVVLDCPRNLQYVSSSGSDVTQHVTVRGLDEFGQAMTETSGIITGATPVLGKKAFKTIISYQSDIVFVGNLSIGTGVLLGMPIALEALGYAFAENVDNAVPTRGTFIAAVNTVPTATTGDVRGTYSPNAAPNAAHAYEVLVCAPDPAYLGLAQFAG